MESGYYVVIGMYLLSIFFIYVGFRLMKYRKKVERTWDRVTATIVGYDISNGKSNNYQDKLILARIKFTYQGKTYKITSQYNHLKPKDLNVDGTTMVLINKEDPEKSMHYVINRHYQAPWMFFFVGSLFIITLTCVLLMIEHYAK